MTNTVEIPAPFRHYTELFRVHIKQLLKLDRKSPIHAVPLLVTIACEVLGRLMGHGGGEEVFAKELRWPQHVTPSIARKLFEVLRNGLAHAYGPYPVILDGKDEIRPIMTWKGGPHLTFVGVRMDGIHARIVPPSQGILSGTWLCIDAESLWKALNQAFLDLEARIGGDRELARTIEENDRRMRRAKSKGPEKQGAEEWRTFREAASFKEHKK